LSKQLTKLKIDLPLLGQKLNTLGLCGRISCSDSSVREIVIRLQLAQSDTSLGCLIATNRLFLLGPTRSEGEAIRRAMVLDSDYRLYLLNLLLESLGQFSHDESLGKTIEQLDHLSVELLHIAKRPLSQSESCKSSDEFEEWTRLLWQSPDAITLLSKVVETPSDFSNLVNGPILQVGFNWLEWETPPTNPAPAPWADASPLGKPLEAVQHPFWGAMVATLDACTGDYEWQSLILRGDLLRSFHRTIGLAHVALDSLWRSEFGIYPVDPLVIAPRLFSDHPLPQVLKSDGRGRSSLPWLRIALYQLHHAEIAIESEGSWRLTDRFRTQLMKDDEHMMAFEAVRQRSYRLARSATKFSLASTNEVAAS
jgi:hypothetical protein